MHLDVTLSSKLVVPETKKSIHGLLAFFGHSCDSWYWLIGLLLLWIFGRGSIKNMSAYWFVGLAILAGVVLVMKFFIKRPRPEGEWGKIYRITDPHSFPSGHAARAMAIAVIATQFGSPCVILALFIWALLVGISRVALQLHYLSDVLVGWLIGIASGYAAIALYPLLSEYSSVLFS